MKKYFYIFFLYIKIINYIYAQIITIPFKRSLPSDITESNFYSSYNDDIIYTTIKVGTPPTEIKAQIKLSQFSLCIKNNSLYDYASSLSYRKNEGEFTSYNMDYVKSIPSNESFIIGKEDISLKNIKFMLTTNSRYNFDGIIGLQIRENNYKTYGHDLISQLKKRGLINKQVFFLNYDEKKENGDLILGEYPHFLKNFKAKYPLEQSESTSVHIPNFDIYYQIVFRSLFWNEKEIESMIIGSLDIDVGFIIGSKFFEDACYNFFEPYIIKRICYKKEANIKNTIYNTYICDDSPEFNMKSFPDIKFYNSDTDFNLTITYDDIFIKKHGKIFFMIIFDKRGYNELWVLGNIFLKSNMLVFDINRRTITFYDKNNINKKEFDNTLYLIIIIIAGFIIVCLLGFIIYKYLFKTKNKKAYELKEDFEYTTGIND